MANLPKGSAGHLADKRDNARKDFQSFLLKQMGFISKNSPKHARSLKSTSVCVSHGARMHLGDGLCGEFHYHPLVFGGQTPQITQP